MARSPSSRYRVLRLLGQGGFGSTWLVEDPAGERWAMKRLALQWHDSPKAVELFRREAEVLQRLDHPGLPRVVDWFSDGEGMALVQSFVDGEDLGKLLDSGRRFTEAEVADLLDRVLEVLLYLHSQVPPVIHRDVKPGNLVLRPDGSVVLIDFGAVKEIAAEGRQGTTVIRSEGYSPPEQLMGRVVPASDLFALGATALHLLTGTPPSDLQDAHTLRFEWAGRAPCSAGLAEVIDRMTAVAPEARYGSAADVVRDLRTLGGGRRSSLPTAPTRLDPAGPFGDGQALLIPQNLKNREDVPPAIRRTARALQAALDGTCTLWYEPLFDPTGERPHLALLLPDRGFAVLEVLDVPGPSVVDLLGRRLKIRLAGHEREVASPLERADRLADTLRARVRGEPRLAGSSIPVAALAVLPSLTREEGRRTGLDRVLDLGRCLFQDDLAPALEGRAPEALRTALLRAMGDPPARPADDGREKLLRGLLQPEVVITRLAGPDSGLFSDDDEDLVLVMDRRQEALARSLGAGHRVLRGVAGSGKTLVLVCRARMMGRLFPNHRFLVTCYTRSLAGDLRAALADCPNVEAVNLDRLMARVIRDAGLRHPGYDDEAGDRVAETALKALALGRGPRYDGVFLDEAQDFGTHALQVVVGLLGPGRDDLLVVADAAQNIFRRRFSWKQAGIRAVGRTQVLRTNYRNTREILQFAYEYLMDGAGLVQGEAPEVDDEHTVIPPEAAGRRGPPPTWIEAAGLRAQVEAAAERAAAWARQGAPPRSVGVLYCSSRDPEGDRGQALHTRLRQLGVDAFWLTDPGQRTRRDGIGGVRSAVVLTTVHSAKGLEFDRVVLCGLRHPDLGPQESRKLAYVAMTRARRELVVVG